MKYKLVGSNPKEHYGSTILSERGIVDVPHFLNPTKDFLQDWRYLEKIDDGCLLIVSTIDDEKPYVIIADSDVDGATSYSILYQYLKRLNPFKEIEVMIHSGKQHGLEDTWQKIQEKDYSLVIVPDAGSNDSQYARQLHCPVLVIDHHILEDEDIVPNMMVINNQTSPYYLNKALSGAGMAWQFCNALDYYFEKDWAKDYIDLAALGIVSDMMSMLEPENRYIVKTGFDNIKNFFFKVLVDKQSFSMGDKVNPITVAFYITPMINAMIRVGTQAEKERLYRAFIDGESLVESHKRGAKGTMERLAVESARECTNAKSKQDKEKERAVERLEVKIFKHDLLENEILFVRLDDDDDFPSELNGLVAMQLSAKYHKPTIVARLNDEGMIRGSARGINQSDLISFKEYLNSTGLFEYTAGHDNAFGISIANYNLDELHSKANSDLKDNDFGESAWEVCFERAASDHDLTDLIFDIGRYEEVWGQQNPTPMIAVKSLFIDKNEIQVIGKNKDTLKIEKDGISYIKFHAKTLIEELASAPVNMEITLIGEGKINEWMGRESAQIMIKDLDIQDARFGF